MTRLGAKGVFGEIRGIQQDRAMHMALPAARQCAERDAGPHGMSKQADGAVGCVGFQGVDHLGQCTARDLGLSPCRPDRATRWPSESDGRAVGSPDAEAFGPRLAALDRILCFGGVKAGMRAIRAIARTVFLPVQHDRDGGGFRQRVQVALPLAHCVAADLHKSHRLPPTCWGWAKRIPQHCDDSSMTPIRGIALEL